ncbi:MAG: ATP-binding protein, partial [Thermodesulfobacteriota bacterium]
MAFKAGRIAQGGCKMCLAISLAIKACYHGFKVYFTTMDTLMRKLKEPQSRHKAYSFSGTGARCLKAPRDQLSMSLQKGGWCLPKITC